MSVVPTVMAVNSPTDERDVFVTPGVNDDKTPTYTT